MAKKFTHPEAVTALNDIAKRWPDDLWLFVEGNNIAIMKTGSKGERVYVCRGGGVDPDYQIGTAVIPADGGGW